jgi:hypothetical protein
MIKSGWGNLTAFLYPCENLPLMRKVARECVTEGEKRAIRESPLQFKKI